MTIARFFSILSFNIQLVTALCLAFYSVNASTAPISNDFAGWKKTLKIDLINHGLPREIVNLAVSNTSDTFASQNSGKRRTFSENSAQQLIAEGFIHQAAFFQHENRELLRQIARTYKISEHFILTLWGMETGFNKESHPDISVIKSLVYRVYQNNKDYQAKQELLNILKSINQGSTELSQLQSKSDGTIGQLNLRPSMYHQYAVDQDADGEIDVWNSVSDSIASAANALNHSGWTHGKPWGYEIIMPPGIDASVIGLTQQISIETLKSFGITRINNQPITESNILASIIQPEGAAGSSYIVFNNFFTLLRWHRSTEYALAFGLLSDQLEQSATMNGSNTFAHAVESP